MPRRAGHVEGAIRAGEVVEACRQLGVEVYKAEGVSPKRRGGGRSIFVIYVVSDRIVPGRLGGTNNGYHVN